MNMQEAIDRAGLSPGRRFRAEKDAPWLRLTHLPVGEKGDIIERLSPATGKWEPATIFAHWVSATTWELEDIPLKAWLEPRDDNEKPSVYWPRFSSEPPPGDEGWIRAPWLDQPPPDLKAPPRPESVR